MKVAVPKARFLSQSAADGIRVTIPVPRQWGRILFLTVWCLMWLYGEIAVIARMLEPDPQTSELFFAAWLLPWSAAGIVALISLLWRLAGREVISITADAFSHRIEAFGIGRSRSFELSQVHRLRLGENADRKSAAELAWLLALTSSGHGMLVFDYGPRTFRCVPYLDIGEAEMVISELRPWLPQSKD